MNLLAEGRGFSPEGEVEEEEEEEEEGADIVT